nr:DUF2281 domain-containing protein [Ancylothrix sp. D3o]
MNCGTAKKQFHRVIDIEIFKTLLKMPESLKKEILHYAQYLLEKHS